MLKNNEPATKDISPFNIPWLVRRINVRFAVLVIFVLISLTIAGYFYVRSRNVHEDPAASAQNETEVLVNKVQQLIVLPEGETPTVATVADPEKLKGQAFFAKAKKGDNVLIYTNAKKAILYDPVAHKIIDVAPLNTGNGPQ